MSLAHVTPSATFSQSLAQKALSATWGLAPGLGTRQKYYSQHLYVSVINFVDVLDIFNICFRLGEGEGESEAPGRGAVDFN